MTQWAFEGSRLWILVALAGGLSLYWRYRRSRREKPEAALWPATLAEGLAWLILLLFLLQPVFLRRTFQFHPPEILIAIDRSQSFRAGLALGLDSLVNASVKEIKRKAKEKGLQVTVWDFANGVRKSESHTPILDGQTRFTALAEAIAVQGTPFRSVILISDGHANPPRPLLEGEFQTPVFPLRLPLGPMLEVQPIAAEWLPSEKGSPERIRLTWMACGLGTRGMRTCLVREGKVAECWERSVDTVLSAWGQQEHELILSANRQSPSASAKPWVLVVTPIPAGGHSDNDTLPLARPDARAKVCWPDGVRSLDETAALRALAGDSVVVEVVSPEAACGDGVRAARWENLTLSARGGTPTWTIAAPIASGMTGPYRSWRYFGDTSSLRYSESGRHLLPPAMGRLSDISAGLYLPLVQDMAGCALEVGNGPQAGCMVGWLRPEATAKDTSPVAFLALPKTWDRLFREEGDPALSRRLAGLMKGSLDLAKLGRGENAFEGKAGFEQEGLLESHWLGLELPALAALAEQSGGKWCEWNQLHAQDTVTVSLPWLGHSTEEVGSPSEERHALRFTWPWFCGVAGLLAFAWFWRKRLFLG